MSQTVAFTIDGKPCEALPGTTILQAADQAGIYIPRLCSHPDLPTARGMHGGDQVWRGEELVRKSDESEFDGCGLCVVELDGQVEPVRACSTQVLPGMKVSTGTDRVKELRRRNLSLILTTHPHSCLTCAQKEGCSREPCSLNVPVLERCCVKLGNCEIERLADYIGIDNATPRFVHPGIPVILSDPLFKRDYNLCVGCGRCVRVCADVRGVEALSCVVSSGKLLVGAASAGLLEANCKFCGACVAVCPTGAILDKDISFPPRAEELVPCIEACPAKMNVPAYVDFISRGQIVDAMDVIMDAAPFPLTLGYACFHPCEDSCRRTALNEPIAICELKRFAAHASGLSGSGGAAKRHAAQSACVHDTGKKVAIVGGGPSGLSAAYYLRLRGIGVTVFDVAEEPGGMLAFGIPEYRLPSDAVRNEVARILETGIELRKGVEVGKHTTLDEIRKEGFDAVLLAIGNQKGKSLNVEGASLGNIEDGLKFLENAKRGLIPENSVAGKKVVVIGGGNVAVDAARTALRFGGEVTVACLESRPEMPCHNWEICSALEEGVRLIGSVGPNKFVGNGKVQGIEFVKCASVFDDAGKFNPKFDSSERSEVPADVVIVAIGLAPDFSVLKGLPVSAQAGRLPLKDDKLTILDGWLFACGDVVNGPGSIVEAIASGKKAADALSRILGVKEMATGEAYVEEIKIRDGRLGKTDGFGKEKRIGIMSLPVNERIERFAVLENVLEGESAIKEASRCLRCNLRLELSQVSRPPEKWLEFSFEVVSTVPEIAGVFELLDNDKKAVLIAGAQNLRERLLKELGKTGVRHFSYEEDEMFTKRESELIQKFIQRYGAMPEGNTIEDDLF